MIKFDSKKAFSSAPEKLKSLEGMQIVVLVDIATTNMTSGIHGLFSGFGKTEDQPRQSDARELLAQLGIGEIDEKKVHYCPCFSISLECFNPEKVWAFLQQEVFENQKILIVEEGLLAFCCADCQQKTLVSSMPELPNREILWLL